MAFAMAGPGAALAGSSFAGVVGAARWQDAAQPAGFTLAGVALVLLAVAVSLPERRTRAWLGCPRCAGRFRWWP